LQWRDAREVTTWRYDGIYAIYNLNSLDIITALYLEPLLRLLGVLYVYAVCDEHGVLVGIFQLAHHGDTVELGLAMRPDLTGQGLGLDFVVAGLDFARMQFAPATFQLDVATFNRRAIRVYERAGFYPVRTFTKRLGGRKVEALEMRRSGYSRAARLPPT
jgi:ribosomal-protein-alanine N-acetyltransferase